MSAGPRGAPAPLRRDAADVGRVLLLGVLVTGAALLQVTLISVIPIRPAGPDLVVITVLAVAHARGAIVGGLLGAWAGFVLDVIPPAAGPLGGWMLVLAVVGTATGRAVAAGRPGPVGAMVILSVGAGAAVLGRAAVLWFAGATPAPDVLAAVAAGAAWGLLLAPLALLLGTPRPRGGRR